MVDTKLRNFKVHTESKAIYCGFKSPKSSPLYSPVNDSFESDNITKIENSKERSKSKVKESSNYIF